MLEEYAQPALGLSSPGFNLTPKVCLVENKIVIPHDSDLPPPIALPRSQIRVAMRKGARDEDQQSWSQRGEG